MNNSLNKNFIIGSFIVHILGILLISTFNSENKIKKKFVVYGAHSKKPTHAYFKELKAPTQTNWMKARAQAQANSKIKIVQKTTNKTKAQKVKPKNNKTVAQKAPQKTAIKKLEKKQIIKKIAKKETIKQAEPKKVASAKKIIPPKQDIKKIEEQIKKIEKIEEQKQIALNKEEEIKVKDEVDVDIKEDEININDETLPETENLHFNLMGETDPNLANFQKHIQTEVERLWRPPLGVAKGTEFSLSFQIDSNGAVENFEIIKRSKALIYDLSVLRIAKNFKFDKCLWNKKFTIDFRQ